MKEIGGYIELNKYTLPMLHEEAIPLNSGRNALAYLIKARKIKKLWIPKFLCDSVKKVCERESVEVKYYSINTDFIPENLEIKKDEWLYIVNYYGQIGNDVIKKMADMYRNIIVDNVQAYFQMPVKDVDTLYTCRKFFGVPDGAFLYTNVKLDEELEQDESGERLKHLLGRYEKTASEYYNEYVNNEEVISNLSMKYMSKITNNLLHGIDYETIKHTRTNNFLLLHQAFAKKNRLKLKIPSGAFMYPLYIKNGAEIRKNLQSQKIYIPTLWPDVFDCCEPSELEYDMAKNILPLPVDQRYSFNEINYMIDALERCMTLC